MAAVTQHRQYHATYPLQSPLGTSRRSSIATNGSNESRSRYRYSIVSHDVGNVNGCPYTHPGDDRNNGSFGTSDSMSHVLPSPVLDNTNRKLHLNGAREMSSNPETSAAHWVSNGYPASSVHDAVTSDHSRTTNQDHDRSPSRLSQASSTATSARTLRRTPRNRRIESPISLHTEDERSIMGRLEATGSSKEAESTLNNTSDSMINTIPGMFPESPKEDRHHGGIASTKTRQRETHTASTNEDESPLMPTHLLQSSDSGAAAGLNIRMVNGNTPTSQPHLGVREEKSKQSQSRRAYPLQAPASNATLHSLLTPPPSPPRHNPAANVTDLYVSEAGTSQPKATTKQVFHKQTYPLQSPASTADFHHENNTFEIKEEQPQHLEGGTKEAAGAFKASEPTSQNLRRQAYPLQAPASIRDLQSRSVEAEPTEEPVEVKKIEAQPPAKPLLGNVKSLRRQAYPLQAPASILDLQEVHQQGKVIDIDSSQKAEPKLAQSQSNQVSPTTAGDTDSSSRKSSIFRRQAYPLQAPASIINLKDAGTRSETPQVAHEELQSSVKDVGNKKMVVKSLRRQGYPLQAPASTINLHEEAQSTPGGQVPEHKDSSPDGQPALGGTAGLKGELEEKPAEHQAYPLQAAASTSQPSHPQVQVSLHDEEVHAKQDLPSIKTNGTSPRSPGSPLYRRQSYPLQVHGEELGSRSVTPQPSTEFRRHPKSILLPKHIPALTDAENSDGEGRTIVVCLDGTGDKFDADNSNIVHLVSALKKDDTRQVTYYQAGIGTYSRNGLSSGFAAAMDMAVGSGLGEHVREAYHFLMHTYKEGDKICIFGFSRGAYTARCLAGMIHKVGLLPPRNIQQIPFAYEFYANDTPEGWEQSIEFKKTFSIDVNVYFIGCFDSVASVGFIPRQLPLSSTPYNKPLYFRHAMALDERRAKFKICRHQVKTLEEALEAKTPTTKIKEAIMSPLPGSKDQNDKPKIYSPSSYGTKNHPNLTDEEYRRIMAPNKSFETNSYEVWFAGAHADVGGGAVPNVERHKLAQIPLRWMIRQAFECNTGILFKTKVLAEHGLDIHTLWPRYERLKAPTHGPPPSFLEKYEKGLPPREVRRSKLVRTDKSANGEPMYHFKSHTDDDWTPEQVEDFYDAITPLNDQLIQAPTWWILEYWPVELKMPVSPGKYYVRTGLNLGRHRCAEEREPNLHWTVLQRMQQLGYKIGVRTAQQTQWKTVV